MTPRKPPLDGADPAKFDHDRRPAPGAEPGDGPSDGPSGGMGASGARIAFVDVEHGSVVVLTPEDAVRRGATVRPASHQDLMIAGRSDLIGPK